MRVHGDDLEAAADAGVINHGQAAALHDFLAARDRGRARFDAAHILYYLGGLLAIGAMTLFMNLGWEYFGGWGLFGLALCYGAGGILLLRHWLYRRDLRVPAALAGAFVVALVPLAVYGLQTALGWWPGGFEYRDYHRQIDWRWLFMELATLGIGLALLWRYRLPFMVAPLAVTLWYLSMDLAPMLLPALQDPRLAWQGELWEFRKFVSIWFGLGMLLVALWVDLRSRNREDFAFWLYLFGLLAFWCGLTLLDSGSEWSRLAYAGVNALVVAVGAVLVRRVFVVFGGFGLAMYAGHLAFDVFENSTLFPFALTAVGLGLVLAGIAWQRHEARIGDALRRPLPAAVRALVERRAASA